MYQQFYSDGLYIHFPLIALIVFLTAFVGVVVWALWVAPKSDSQARLARIASLPLSDGEVTNERA